MQALSWNISLKTPEGSVLIHKLSRMHAVAMVTLKAYFLAPNA